MKPLIIKKVLAIWSAILLIILSIIPIKIAAAQNNFGTGTGISPWPNSVVAPYADMTAWVTGTSGINGSIDLAKVSEDTGIKFFNVAFIQAVDVESDRINWAWGAFRTLNEKNSSNAQYNGIKQSILKLRENGGDVAISFGGANAGAFWTVTQDVDILFNTYKEIIDGYGLKRIDLDIEGADMDFDQNVANAKAIKKIQQETGIEVSLTIPAMNFGLTSHGKKVVEAYLQEGVELKVINLMTMNFGTSVPDYAQGAIDAVDNVKNQIKTIYQTYGKTLTDEQAYKMLGMTPSIGFESDLHPYFDTTMTQKLVDFANEKNIGMMSFWSMNRDAKVDNCRGKIIEKYEHSKIMTTFSGSDLNNDDSTKNDGVPDDTNNDDNSTKNDGTPDTENTKNDELPNENNNNDKLPADDDKNGKNPKIDVNTSKNPNTGEQNTIMIYLNLLFLLLTTIFLVLLKKKKTI